MPLTPTTTDTADTATTGLTPPRREDHLTDGLDEHTLQDELGQSERTVTLGQVNPAFTGQSLSALADWARGDLAYGLSGERESNLADESNASRLSMTRDLPTIDLFNNFFGLTNAAWEKIDPSSSEAEVRETLSEKMEADLKSVRDKAAGDPNNELNAAAANKLPLLEAYKVYMLDARNPNNIVKAFRSRPEERNSTEPLVESVRGMPIIKQPNKSAQDGARAFKTVRRACKAGLNMVHQVEPWKSRGAMVHFELGGMGDLALSAKAAPIRQRTGRSVYVPITSSELRHAYDNRMTFDRMRYYVNAKEVHAPWSGLWTEAEGVTASAGVWNAGRLGRKMMGGPSVITPP